MTCPRCGTHLTHPGLIVCPSCGCIAHAARNGIAEPLAAYVPETHAPPLGNLLLQCRLAHIAHQTH